MRYASPLQAAVASPDRETAVAMLELAWAEFHRQYADRFLYPLRFS